MDFYCSNCGNKLEINADVCLKCGKIIKKDTTQIKIKTGLGRSIASMILGIISIFGSLLIILVFDEIKNEIIFYTELSEIIGCIIGFSIFTIPTSVTGLSLGVSGTRVKKGGFNISGIILNGLSILVTVILIILLLINVL